MRRVFKMIDCHCHLVDKKFKNDVNEVIQRAKEAGISHAVVLPEYPSQFQAVLDLKQQHPDFIIAGVGVHPIQVFCNFYASTFQKRNRSVRLNHIPAVEVALAKWHDKIDCIGEVGLDFTTDLFKVSDEDRLVQEKCFREQIQFAKSYDLPLTSEVDTIRILLDEEYNRALLHAYGGPISDALKAAEAGIYFSIPPCFSLSEKGRLLVEALPLDNLLLETDSPVLGIKKGERNEPANCIISAEFIAEVPVEQVKEITTTNAKRLFKLQA